MDSTGRIGSCVTELQTECIPFQFWFEVELPLALLCVVSLALHARCDSAPIELARTVGGYRPDVAAPKLKARQCHALGLIAYDTVLRPD